MFFTVFRYGVGEEYFQYEELFKQVLPINKISISYFKDNVHDIEYGYLFFESVIKYFTDEHLVFLVFYVFAMFLFLYKAINNTGLYRNIQLLIFYSFIFLEYIFSVHRQGVAMCIIYYAIILMIHEDKLFILFLFYKRIPYTYSNLLLLYVSLFFIFSNVGVLANRVSGILLVSYAIFFSVLICNLKFKRDRLLIILYMFFLT
ncbi:MULTISPECIES: EpsG family protein [Haemophilus]|uniref:EpsG family protein n=1 Tax=Haemophilus TaxID=724 RepID=UPI001CBB78A0|nr:MULTISPECIES: EpsG family protein [Haemophilus]